ncbi:MAG: hypothetical protein KAS32_02000 [Candidatus Peribacteraceae bacterium]|nr:hypothetical protein [Candidatus Peribacteraceae bacterium]
MTSKKYFDLLFINEAGDLSYLDEGALSVIKEFKDGVSKTLFGLGSALQKENIDIKSIKQEVNENVKREGKSIGKLLKRGAIRDASDLFTSVFRSLWNSLKQKFNTIEASVLMAVGIFAFILFMYLIAILLVKMGMFALIVGTGIILTIIAISMFNSAMMYLRTKKKVTGAFILTEKDSNAIIEKACIKLGVDSRKLIGYLSKGTNSSFNMAKTYIEDTLKMNLFLRKSISAGFVLVIFKGVKSLSNTN